MADISKIVLPSGNEYDIKDAVARQAIAGGIGFVIVWTQTDWASSTAPDSAKLATIPAGVTVHYNSGASTATGTLVAGESTIGNFYLIYSTTQIGSKDVYNEYVTVSSGGYFWEKIGDTEVDLTGVVTDVSINSTGHTDTVIGTDSTFTITQPSVTLASGSTGDVTVATGTVSSVTQPTIALSTGSSSGTGKVAYIDGVSTTKAKATATGANTAWNSKDQVTALTGLGTPSTTSAASSVTPTTKKLATTTITGVSGSTAITPVESRTSQTTADGTGTESTNNADWLKGLSVTGETLTIGAATLDTQTTYSAGAPRASLAVPTAASSTTTVATGSTTTTGSGADVVTDVSVGDTVTVVTGYASPTTDTVIGSDATFTITQPTVTLSTASTGDITVATGAGTTKYMGGTASGSAVTLATTKLSGSASGANTAWNSKDSVTVLKSDTTLNVTKGTNSGE